MNPITGLDAVFVLDDYWFPDRTERTHVGELVYRAKDQGDFKAARDLADLFKTLGAQVGKVEGFVKDRKPPLIAAVPSSGQKAVFQLNVLLAEALAETGVGTYLAGLLTRQNTELRLREVSPDLRYHDVAELGYAVKASRIRTSNVGWPVILVDDVILTGSTLRMLAALLRKAGATSVIALVAARTRTA